MHRRSSGFSVQDEAEPNPIPRLLRASTDDGNNLRPSHELSEPLLPFPTARSSPGSLDLNRSPRSRNYSAIRSSLSRATTPTTSNIISNPTNLPSRSAAEKMIPLGSQRLSMEGSPEAPRSRYSRFRNPWSASLLAIGVTLFGVLSLLSILHGFANRSVGADGCAVPSMNPTYIRMLGFDAEHTRFASKYNLFLYREEGVDPYTQENIGVSSLELYLSRIRTRIFVDSSSLSIS
jgi:glycosylphosphatidylinositol deacylase